MVSRERARKTRQRQKLAAERSAPAGSFRNRPFIGGVVVFLMWAATGVAMRAPSLLQAGARVETLFPLAGDAVFALAGIFVTALFLHAVEPSLIRRNSRITFMAVIIMIAAALSLFILYLAGSSALLSLDTARFLLPFTLAPLLATLLLGPNAGIATGVFSSLLFALYADRRLDVLFTGLIATAMTCHTLYRVRTRTRVIKLALFVGITQIICVLGVTALDWNQPSAMPILHKTAACLAGATLSAIIALLILPFFEHVFDITSDISLLEFSDLGHPLLQRLALEAPGTYHHSLVVANIAQSAADAIGANSLEARVSAYFHDIGKLTKPTFFAENIHLQDNPHDHLSPSMSTLIITSHVKEGLSLAMLYKLPTAVKSAIREHHGSSMLQCFHHKAMTQLELGMGLPNGGGTAARMDDTCFRYQGPRPSTRVSGIICLADAVEAASRSLEKPTPGHIETLVNDIVRQRLDDGQLDECALSLLELSQIRRAFVFTLTTMLHGRLAYPKNELKDSKPPTPVSGEPAMPPAAGDLDSSVR